MPDDQPALDPRAAAAELRSLRAGLLDALERLPEARLYGHTPREGWTLRHTLSALAAADAELEHVLEAARRAGMLPPPRRLRGEAMHRAHELRLPALRSHLAERTEHAAASLEAAAPLPGEARRDLAPYLAACLVQTREALEAVVQAAPPLAQPLPPRAPRP
jgi:hypothetical protein